MLPAHSAVQFHRRRSNNNGARPRRENDAPETSWERFNEDINYADVFMYNTHMCTRRTNCFAKKLEGAKWLKHQRCANSVANYKQSKLHFLIDYSGITIRRCNVRYIYLSMCVIRAVDLLDLQEIVQCCGIYFLVKFSACEAYHWIGERELENNINLLFLF